MDQIGLMRQLCLKTETKIVLVVLDGLGGLPNDAGKTELETAHVPNLDALASQSICGLSDPVLPGITPGSGPGHLALFGYDPLQCMIGRGILEALGIDFDLKPGDVAARGNLCTLDDQGIITDRRAGRVDTEKSRIIASQLDGIEIEGVRVIVEAVKDHRVVVVFRGEGLSDSVTDSDPQRVGLAPQPVFAGNDDSTKMARIANVFLTQASKILAGHHPANGLLLRGFSRMPHFPGFKDVYKLDACAIASYPMYRGLAKVVGMTVVKTGATLDDEIKTLKENFNKYDFFFLHVKATDAAGEDGDFGRKVSVLEDFDRRLPLIIGLKPDVMVVTGDHSTPATLGGHGWHAVPVVVNGKFCRPDTVSAFNETACISGGLGHIPACHIMPLAMANALKLEKYGA
ncbi:2,3-bisphosphoglycerate-independent phosphoglycerate mutase [Dehalogenimonas formicexedens]|uniref:2,3-bisphosphoglycerate-independent phosphoglycerate mutase n=1 Tax=Dehalogenimonas formicexedens TaxID=1839801 RepID=A0A1P8F752_9CHLR|nr:2,3-bisphosphoglycerate-independent phosphoglycerate mutase [Dehalogenimonas formicexedens]APV44182.1 2,3-bisphosphoglycerate-independent phosphoglycerate mutase [Dehalogenimonas formicexedens]